MSSRNNTRLAQTRVDLTTTERQPDPSDEQRGRLRIHLKGVEWEGGNLSSAGVTAVVGLFLAGGLATATVIGAFQAASDDVLAVLLGGGVLVVAITIATIILVRTVSGDGQRVRLGSRAASANRAGNGWRGGDQQGKVVRRRQGR